MFEASSHVPHSWLGFVKVETVGLALKHPRLLISVRKPSRRHLYIHSAEAFWGVWRNENTVGANHITQTSRDKSQQRQAPTMWCDHGDCCQDNQLPLSDARTWMMCRLVRETTERGWKRAETDKRRAEESKRLKGRWGTETPVKHPAENLIEYLQTAPKAVYYSTTGAFCRL